MLKSLRGRLMLSHILPVLIVTPLVGLTLVYVLETQVMLEALSVELKGQAMLIATVASSRTEIWHDESQAQSFVSVMDHRLGVRVMLLDRDGYLLSSSDPVDVDQKGKPLAMAEQAAAQPGEATVHTSYGIAARKEVVDVWMPVMDANRQVVGWVRLSYLADAVGERFLRHRYLIIYVLIGGLLLGAVLGLLLATSLQRPLWQVTQAVSQLIEGERLGPLAEQGPQEIRGLVSAVNTLVERLRSMEAARRKLLANLVHELGRPLGAFRSAIQAMLRGADKNTTLRRDLLSGMDKEVDRLQLLLEDLATLHDRSLGPLELDLRPTDVGEWLTQTLSTWREAAQSRGLDWRVSVPPTFPAVQMDPDRMGQALGNLLSNAIKYTPPGGTVAVDAGADGSTVWMRVSDTGPGIPPEEQERIFAPFYRSQAGRRFPQGMGLGLSIARDVALAHGGRLDLESTPGEGSQFTLSIPVEPQ